MSDPAGDASLVPIIRTQQVAPTCARPGRRALLALPSILAALIVGPVAFDVTSSNNAQVCHEYRREAERLIQTGRYKAARVCFERLLQLEPGQADIRFRLALVREHLGESRRAVALMAKLAEAEGGGYAPAHLWFAERLLSGTPSSQVFDSAFTHLRLALEANPDQVLANSLIGQLYLATGEPAVALPYLKKSADAQPELLLVIAKACKSMLDDSEANRWAAQARELYRIRTERKPTDAAAYLHWADVEIFFGKFETAVTVLTRGLTKVDTPSLRKAMGQVYLRWHDVMKEKTPKTTVGERLDLLERGLAHDAANFDLLQRFLEIMNSGGAEAERARSALQEALASGRASALVHFTLGTDAWQRNRLDEAQFHWEQAQALSPNIPVIANNLAWVLAHREAPELPRALELIERVIERWPNYPEFRGTRGAILVKMGRWKQAMPDLESSLRANPESREIHEALASAYDHLDMPALAAEHRRRARDGRTGKEQTFHDGDTRGNPRSGALASEAS